MVAVVDVNGELAVTVEMTETVAVTVVVAGVIAGGVAELAIAVTVVIRDTVVVKVEMVEYKVGTEEL